MLYMGGLHSTQFICVCFVVLEEFSVSGRTISAMEYDSISIDCPQTQKKGVRKFSPLLRINLLAVCAT